MKHVLHFIFLLQFISLSTSAQSKKTRSSDTTYFPLRGEWQHRSPSTLNLDSTALAASIKFALGNEAKMPRDQQLAQSMTFGREPYDEGVGPFADRGEPTGLIIYKGYIVAEWGQP